MRNQEIIDILTADEKKNVYEALKALINFNFQSQLEADFNRDVEPKLSGIQNIIRHLGEKLDNDYGQDSEHGKIYISPDFQSFRRKIEEFNYESLKNEALVYDDHNLLRAVSFYEHSRLSTFLSMCYKDLHDSSPEIKAIYTKGLHGINFNSENAQKEFKDLCEAIHASHAFQAPQQKEQLSVICNDDYQLDNEKINNLYKKFQLIADKDTGKISKEKLAEYTSDRTVMDFIRMILSYLPQVIKDAIGLNEELGKKWQNKVALKPIIIESERLGMF